MPTITEPTGGLLNEISEGTYGHPDRLPRGRHLPRRGGDLRDDPEDRAAGRRGRPTRRPGAAQAAQLRLGRRARGRTGRAYEGPHFGQARAARGSRRRLPRAGAGTPPAPPPPPNP